MKKIIAIGSLTAVLSACSHPVDVVTPVTATSQPAELVQIQPEQAQAAPTDSQLFTKAQIDLKVLGYLAGKVVGPKDPAFARAVVAFQKDHGLAQDGMLSTGLVARIGATRAALRPAANPVRTAQYFYSGRNDRTFIELGSAPEGFTADAKGNLYASVRATGETSFKITRANGTAEEVTCHIVRPSVEAISVAEDGVALDCVAGQSITWHDVFSPRLGVVVSRHIGAKSYALMAVRPSTAGWPVAARTGLDWATSAALSGPVLSPAIRWSSTGVSDKYDIHAGATVKLGEGDACRRFELVQVPGGQTLPAIACHTKSGEWSIPGTGTKIAVLMRAAINAK